MKSFRKHLFGKMTLKRNWERGIWKLGRVNLKSKNLEARMS